MLKRWVVAGLEKFCTLTHPIVHRRPFLWLPLPICPLATLAGVLGTRWGVYPTPPVEVATPVTTNHAHGWVTFDFTQGQVQS